MSALGWFCAGGVAMIVVGALHLSGELAPLPSDPAFAALREAMSAYTVNIAGIATNAQAIHHDLAALVVTNAAFRVAPPAVFYTLAALLFGMAALRARA